jgi:hypothetical protein
MADSRGGGSLPYPSADVYDLSTQGGYLALASKLAPGSKTLLAVAEQAFRAGAQMAVVEWEYRDVDYQSEYSSHYARHFKEHSGLSARVHFFKDAPPQELDAEDIPLRFHDLNYLGYCVLRPLGRGVVGRTLISPPSDLRRWTTCAVADETNLFGAQLKVSAAPFMSQDVELGRCAHAVIWMATYCYWKLHEASRPLPAEIAGLVPTELGSNRPVPSTGLSARQVIETCRRLGLPAVNYSRQHVEDADLKALARRYLNSGFPVIVGGNRHTILLVGYRPTRSRFRNRRAITYIYQDDLAGPYRTSDQPLGGEWEQVIVPLVPEIHVPADEALTTAKTYLSFYLGSSPDQSDKRFSDRLANQDLEYEISAVRSNQFKASLVDRGFPIELAVEYERLPMPKWIWITEVVEPLARDQGDPCVLAEVLVDSTSLASPHILAWRIPSGLSIPLRDPEGTDHWLGKRKGADSTPSPGSSSVQTRPYEGMPMVYSASKWGMPL